MLFSSSAGAKKSSVSHHDSGIRKTRSGVMLGDAEGELEAGFREGVYRKINPLDSVYSFMMFTLPIEEKSGAGLYSWKSLLAYSLVAATLMIKGILLWAIFHAIVLDDYEWQQSMMGNYGFEFLKGTEQQCNTDRSLCRYSNGTFTCAPPTVQLTGRWDELDTNGDGVWTHEEAVSAKSRLKCKYGVNPVEVHDIFVKAVLEFKDKIWVHPDLAAGRSIHKAYFTYASGELIMCGYRNHEMCANLLQRGVFDAPLKYGTAPRVGQTIDSALAYCHKMLDRGGFCERNLPSAYTVWKKSSDRQCWGPRYDKFEYQHPTDGKTKSMLSLDYKARRAYTRAASNNLFIIYRTIIVMMFLLALYGDFKDIAVTMSWVVKFPSASEFPGSGVLSHETPRGGTETLVRGISTSHRLIMGLIVLLRVCMMFMLVSVGVTFLLQDTSWIELLLNGVALVFVMEVANHVFSQVLDSHLQEQFMEMEPMYVQMLGLDWLNRRPALRDVLGFSTLCLVVFVVAQIHLHKVAYPLSQAVECACLSSGTHCRESIDFDKSFWDKYWTQDVPGIYQSVAKLKAHAANNVPPAKIKSDSEETATTIQASSPIAASKAGDTIAEQATHSQPIRTSESKEKAQAGGVRWHIVGVRGRQRPPRPNQIRMLNKAKLTSGTANP